MTLEEGRVFNGSKAMKELLFPKCTRVKYSQCFPGIIIKFDLKLNNVFKLVSFTLYSTSFYNSFILLYLPENPGEHLHT